ncbi:hypothetical protein FKM82_019680 [Ascaphus truei]
MSTKVSVVAIISYYLLFTLVNIHQCNTLERQSHLEIRPGESVSDRVHETWVICSNGSLQDNTTISLPFMLG